MKAYSATTRTSISSANQRTNNRDERRASDSSLMLAVGRGVRQKRASLGYELHTGNLIGSQCFKRPAQRGRGGQSADRITYAK